jgi:hypothetical protein
VVVHCNGLDFRHGMGELVASLGLLILRAVEVHDCIIDRCFVNRVVDGSRDGGCLVIYSLRRPLDGRGPLLNLRFRPGNFSLDRSMSAS